MYLSQMLVVLTSLIVLWAEESIRGQAVLSRATFFG